MKRIFVFLVFLNSLHIISQNEVKLDISDALGLQALDISFEHYLTEQTSVGISTLFNFEDESSDFRYNENFVIASNLRHYFSSDKSWNWFGELFFAYSLGDKNANIDFSDGALGIALGYKYISAGGFTVDLHAGGGRNLFSKDSPVVILRTGINVGYQF